MRRRQFAWGAFLLATASSRIRIHGGCSRRLPIRPIPLAGGEGVSWSRPHALAPGISPPSALCPPDAAVRFPTGQGGFYLPMFLTPPERAASAPGRNGAHLVRSR